MRRLFVMVVLGGLAGLGMLSTAVVAAPLDGSAPMLCAVSSVSECSRQGVCERSMLEDTQVPPFVRINVQQRVIGTVDGARTSPIATVQRANGRLMLQGTQNERVWGAVVNEETGQMSATASEVDGAIFISGTCIVP